MKKYIFVTGGVVSGLGKGITAASLGRLLKARGLKVAAQKLDPYINVDPGTMSPYQHGEVYVTEDGSETDLDLGHYERFIDENLNPYTGDWIARTLLKQRGDVIPDRGKDYNHSTFVDNIIADLVGLHVDERGRISLNPLLPQGYWDWFALMDVSLAGHRVDVIYDRTGRHYGRGKGLQLIIDGKARRIKLKQ